MRSHTRMRNSRDRVYAEGGHLIITGKVTFHGVTREMTAARRPTGRKKTGGGWSFELSLAAFRSTAIPPDDPRRRRAELLLAAVFGWNRSMTGENLRAHGLLAAALMLLAGCGTTEIASRWGAATPASTHAWLHPHSTTRGFPGQFSTIASTSTSDSGRTTGNCKGSCYTKE